jgi:hypothetical protein
MATIENSELDFSELDGMSELELDLYFNLLIEQNNAYLLLFDDPEFQESLDLKLIEESRNYYMNILELFIDWELFDYVEDIHLILINLELLEEKLKK